MNSWRSRMAMLFLILAAMLGHGIALEAIPNTPEGMLLFHGSAALLDWLLLIIAPYLLVGGLSQDTQWLLMASIFGNYVGWGLYMAYMPPVIYNFSMLLLTGVQIMRLFIPDSHDADDSRNDMVRHSDSSRIGNVARMEK